MRYICTVILICGLFMGQAWADRFRYLPDPIESFYDCPPNVDCTYINPHADGEVAIDLSEIRALLERCSEVLNYQTTGEIMVGSRDVDKDAPLIVTDPDQTIVILELRRDIEAMLERLSE